MKSDASDNKLNDADSGNADTCKANSGGTGTGTAGAGSADAGKAESRCINTSTASLLPKRIASYGLLLALSMVLSYVEAMIPVNLGIPGVKLGLANMVTMIGLYTIGVPGTAAVSLLRILLVSVTFGNFMTLSYSLAGWAMSFIIMILLIRFTRLSRVSVSAAGGVMHNIGQLTMAVILMKTQALYYYLPVLMLAGVVSGIVIGVISGMVAERIKVILK